MAGIGSTISISAIGRSILMAAIAAIILTSAAIAQTSQSTGAGDLESIIEGARDSGATVIVIQQDASEAETAQSEKSTQQAMGETALLARQNLIAIFRELPEFPARAVEAIRK
ncbi:MAG: hypothetical protein HKN60_04965, partial [Rhizobiales bacterium]|nr:hypothetical protein [Hyphomicrobiales bacterium]